MSKRLLVGIVIGGALLATSSPQAHHSLAGVYDLNKVEKAAGIVRKFAFVNPHGALYIDIKNAAGVATLWHLTTGSANVLTNAGISATGPNRVKTGDTITVTFNPAHSGAPVGFLRSMTLPDKTTAEFVPD